MLRRYLQNQEPHGLSKGDGMSSLFSPVDSINKLVFKNLKNGQQLRNATVMRIAGTLIVKSEDGTLFCDQFRRGGGAYTLGQWPWLNSLLRGLVKLKVITKAEQMEHQAEARKKSEADDRKYHAETLEKILAKNNLKPTSQMKKFMKDNPPKRFRM